MNDFSSDKILETYARLNELSWRDNDVCPTCGMMYSEVGGDCVIETCPNVKSEDNED